MPQKVQYVYRGRKDLSSETARFPRAPSREGRRGCQVTYSLQDYPLKDPSLPLFYFPLAFFETSLLKEFCFLNEKETLFPPRYPYYRMSGAEVCA